MATVVWNILDAPQSLHRINRATQEPYENPVDSVGNNVKWQDSTTSPKVQ